jgi:hypothetical protein
MKSIKSSNKIHISTLANENVTKFMMEAQKQPCEKNYPEFIIQTFQSKRALGWHKI